MNKGLWMGKLCHHLTKEMQLYPCQLGFTSLNLDQVTDSFGKSLKFKNYENKNYIHGEI